MGEHFLVKRQRNNPFVDGTSGKKIIKILDGKL